MLISGLALSVDNLAAGFAFGAYHTQLAVAAVVVAALVSVVMSLAAGAGAIGIAAGERSERSPRDPRPRLPAACGGRVLETHGIHDGTDDARGAA